MNNKIGKIIERLKNKEKVGIEDIKEASKDISSDDGWLFTLLIIMTFAFNDKEGE